MHYKNSPVSFFFKAAHNTTPIVSISALWCTKNCRCVVVCYLCTLWCDSNWKPLQYTTLRPLSHWAGEIWCGLTSLSHWVVFCPAASVCFLKAHYNALHLDPFHMVWLHCRCSTVYLRVWCWLAAHSYRVLICQAVFVRFQKLRQPLLMWRVSRPQITKTVVTKSLKSELYYPFTCL